MAQLALRPASTRVWQGLSSTFDLINTIRIATEDTVERVDRLLEAGATDKVLSKLYATEVEEGGRNLRFFAGKSREGRQSIIAGLWLLDVISRYEAWAEELDQARAYQFPSKGLTACAIYKTEGFDRRTVGGVESPVMGEIYASLPATMRPGELLIDGDIDRGLVLYRYYKEIRNSHAHRGGRADSKLQAAAEAASSAAQGLNIGEDGQIPIIFPPRPGDQVTLDYRTVRLVVSLLFRLIRSIEFSYLVSTDGEITWLQLWDKTHSGQLVVEQGELDRGKWLSTRLATASIPVPAPAGMAACVRFLRDHRKLRLA